MYINIGEEFLINTKNIVAILDMDLTTISKITKEFLKTMDEEEFIVDVSYGKLPKTYIIAEENNQSKVYVSPLSCSTLSKRLSEVKYK